VRGTASKPKTATGSVGRRSSADDAWRMSLGPISNAIGSTHLPGPNVDSRASFAAANDQIRQDKQQLDDWTTCVSAKTTKGQAEIQRLSGELSAAEARSQRLAAQQPQASSLAVPSHSIDVWA
jgi:hypothetical protein